MSKMSGNRFGTIIQIGNCLVSEEVVTEFFACDYEKCHGCCCVVGDSGAPLKEEEVGKIEEEYKNYSHLMTAEGREAAESSGFFEIDTDGDFVTPTVKTLHKVPGLDYIPGALDGVVGSAGLGDCAYIHYEQGGQGQRTSCFCSIERSYFQGRCRFRKPVSCWLYPIRISRLSSGADALNFHRWSICKDAFIKGEKEGVRVYQFLKEPLTALYGEEFYSALCAAAEMINSER